MTDAQHGDEKNSNAVFFYSSKFADSFFKSVTSVCFSSFVKFFQLAFISSVDRVVVFVVYWEPAVVRQTFFLRLSVLSFFNSTKP